MRLFIITAILCYFPIQNEAATADDMRYSNLPSRSKKHQQAKLPGKEEDLATGHLTFKFIGRMGDKRIYLQQGSESSWAEAQKLCSHLGMEGLEILSESDNGFLRDMLNKLPKVEDEGKERDKGYWTAGVYKPKIHHFTWENDKRNTQVGQNWHPTFGYKESELLCIAVTKGKSWLLRPCFHKKCVLCQIRKGNTEDEHEPEIIDEQEGVDVEFVDGKKVVKT